MPEFKFVGQTERGSAAMTLARNNKKPVNGVETKAEKTVQQSQYLQTRREYLHCGDMGCVSKSSVRTGILIYE